MVDERLFYVGPADDKIRIQNNESIGTSDQAALAQRPDTAQTEATNAGPCAGQHSGEKVLNHPPGLTEHQRQIFELHKLAA